MARPYKEAGWDVIQIDIKLGKDVFDFKLDNSNVYGKVVIHAMIPCTDYALSGARWFQKKDDSGITIKSQKLVYKTKEIINHYKWHYNLIAWHIENPMSRIHKLNSWMGNPVLKFNPCDYAGYDPEPDNSRYNKMTWIWGNFNIPDKKRLEPIEKDNPGWCKYGGKSERTKELRSITPLGWAYAFYEFNH